MYIQLSKRKWVYFETTVPFIAGEFWKFVRSFRSTSQTCHPLSGAPGHIASPYPMKVFWRRANQSLFLLLYTSNKNVDIKFSAHNALFELLSSEKQ
jgi:hypothetical protein